MPSLFRKLFKISASQLGRKIGNDFHNFGRKVKNVTYKIDNGLNQFDNGLNQTRNILEKFSSVDPTGLSKVGVGAVDFLKQGSNVVRTGSGLARNIVRGDAEGAYNSGKQLGSIGGDFLKTTGQIAGDIAPYALALV